MRKKLQKINDLRTKFTGRFVRFGVKYGWRSHPFHTILLRDIRDANNNPITDHTWMNYTKEFQELGNVEEGDLISFYARVKDYKKGYVSERDFIDERTVDYKLTHPTQFKKVS